MIRDLIIFSCWAYYNVGAALLIWRGDDITKPAQRALAWLLWPFRSWRGQNKLYDYFVECWKTQPYPTIDHSLRVDRLPNGNFHFYIHPSNGPGVTTDFLVSPTETKARYSFL